VFVQWIGLGFVDEALLGSLAATLVDVFAHVEIYQPSGGMGVLFAASDAPLASLDGAARALRAAPKDFASLGIQRVEDFAVARVLDEMGVRAFAAQSALNTDDHNHVASRASRLGGASLTPRSVHKLWKDHDPLAAGMGGLVDGKDGLVDGKGGQIVEQGGQADGMGGRIAGADGLDRSALIRRLVSANFTARATALSRSEDDALEETGLGWIEFGNGRPRRAARHFTRALKLAPDSRDALAGLVASRPGGFADGKSVAGFSEQDLDDRLAALIAGNRHATAGDWGAVAALDSELGRLEPGEPLFEQASRLRIRWRLAAQDPELAAEAQAIAETLLSRTLQLQDVLMRARAAVAAGRFTAAWGALSRVADALPQQQRARALADEALEVAGSLPDELARGLRDRLQASGPSAVRR
jgi:tetratricopeptide (TPR) repeat protein